MTPRCALPIWVNSPATPSEQTRPTCRGCCHYYITHDPRFPYGCRAMDFKSKVSPHRAVEQASHGMCLRFEKKA